MYCFLDIEKNREHFRKKTTMLSAKNDEKAYAKALVALKEELADFSTKLCSGLSQMTILPNQPNISFKKSLKDFCFVCRIYSIIE